MRQFPIPPFTIIRAKSLNALPDPPDIILLRNDKRDHHLPHILPQNPDSTAKIRRPGKICIFSAHRSNTTAVISVYIKILPPDGVILFPAAKQSQFLLRLFHFQIVSEGCQTVPLLIQTVHAEALPGFTDLLYGQIGNLYFDHCIVFCHFKIMPFSAGTPQIPVAKKN